MCRPGMPAPMMYPRPPPVMMSQPVPPPPARGESGGRALMSYDSKFLPCGPCGATQKPSRAKLT
eukprot:38543-Prorocentrum_lima.AAC.1